jgi:hypothetical protein
MKIVNVAVVCLFVASASVADGTVQQKTQMRFGGAIGSVINVFGRKATHEGVTSETAIHGKRKNTRSGDSGDIIDLDQEKVYHVDYEDKTYTVTTFAELRKQYEEQKARAKKEPTKTDSKGEKGPEYDVDFSVKSTGKKETINGWNTHEEIATVTVREKGKKLEESGGFVLTANMWMGPRLSALRELADFDRKFMQKVYGSAFEGDMRQMAAMMAATPAFAKAMKTFGEKKSNLDGTAIRTIMTFEAVAGSNQTASEDSPSPAAAIGGLLGRIRKRRDEGKDDKPSDPNRSTMLTTNTELLKATTSSSADAVAIPSNFKQR